MAGRKRQLPRGVKIRQYANSEAIQIAFTYKGIECRETLKLPATAGNLRYAENLRHEILAEIERGTFNYQEKFPESKRAAKFGFQTRRPFMRTLFDEALAMKKPQLKSSSIKAYTNSVELQLKPAFGHLRIDMITPKAIRDWFVNSGLSAKTLRNHRVMLDFTLDWAVQEKMIPSNPSDSLKLEHILPKKQLTSDYEPDPLNKTEIAAVIEAADDWYRQMIITWLFTGVRPGELLGLRWSDIDFKNRAIHVRRARVLGVEDAPKTVTSIRQIDMLPMVYDALQAQRQQTYFISGADGYVFLSKHQKKPFNDHRGLGRAAWNPAIKAAGIRHRNQYQARHTFASQMLTEGNDPWWLARQMGHKGIEMINRVYGKWIPDNGATAYQPKGDWSEVVTNSHAGRTD
jgi:integrase